MDFWEWYFVKKKELLEYAGKDDGRGQHGFFSSILDSFWYYMKCKFNPITANKDCFAESKKDN